MQGVSGQFSRQQLQLARQLFSAPQARLAGPKVRLALAETPLVESGLSSEPQENSEGAAGPLQQTPRQGWGTLAQVDNPRHAAESFLKRAIPLAGKYGTAGQLAQAVQRSAYPERYDQHKGEALELLKELGGGLGAGGGEGGGSGARGQLSVSTTSSMGSPQALQEVLAQVKALSGPTVLAAQAQPARPAFSAGPTLPEGSKAPAPIQQKSPESSLLPLLEHALGAAQTPNVESKVQQTHAEPGSLPQASPQSNAKLAGILTEANHIAAAKVPYLWGGGHAGRILPGGKVTPLDCSGAVSAALGVDPKVSGQFEGWGAPGKGQHVTIYANSKHVLMEVDGRFWGTSGSNAGGGAGWIKPGVISSDYLKAFAARHPAGL